MKDMKSFVKRSEKQIETRLRRRLKSEIPSAMCIKFVSPGCVGVPDRIIILPGGFIVFAELKAPGRSERRIQERIQDKMSRLGCHVMSCVDSYEAVEELISYCVELCRKGQLSE